MSHEVDNGLNISIDKNRLDILSESILDYLERVTRCSISTLLADLAYGIPFNNEIIMTLFRILSQNANKRGYVLFHYPIIDPYDSVNIKIYDYMVEIANYGD